MREAVHESAEDYLETILKLSYELPVVRSVDIANEMDYKKSSVSVAMKNLRLSGHIEVSDAGFITLTESGMEIAKRIYERHLFFTNWLVMLGVDEKTARHDACKLEHDMSVESFEAIRKFVEEKTAAE